MQPRTKWAGVKMSSRFCCSGSPLEPAGAKMCDRGSLQVASWGKTHWIRTITTSSSQDSTVGPVWRELFLANYFKE